MRNFCLLLKGDSQSPPRKIEFEAQHPSHAFHVAEREEHDRRMELWEGGRLLGTLRRAKDDVWTLS